MKKISSWAKNNKRPARMLIIVSVIVLNTLAIVTGVLLNSLGIYLPLSFLLFFAGLYALGFVVYPSRSLKGKKLNAAAFYIRQKSCDLLLVGSTFFMISWLGNHPDRLFRYGPTLQAVVPGNTVPRDSTLKTYKPISAFTASMRDEKGNPLKWKERKKLLKEQVKAIKRSTEPSKGAKIALIILSILGAVLLIYGVAALACSLSCGGSDALAIIVAIGGTALVVWLTFVVIKSITGKKKEPGKEPAPAS